MRNCCGKTNLSKGMMEGDSNTTYFHLPTIIHRKNNQINHLKLSNGSWSCELGTIGDDFVQYFSNLFLSSNPIYPKNLDDLIICTITEDDNELLCSILNSEEIRLVVFMMNSFKSPTPYGFSHLFSINYWYIVNLVVIDVL